MTESIQLYLNSKDADTVSNNTYYFYIKNLEVSDNCYIYLSVQHASIPYSFYNINSYNNVFNILMNNVSYSYTITPGNYNINQLVSYLKKYMTNFDITYSSITNKLTITHPNYDFIIMETSTCLSILGFDETNTYAITKTITSPNRINLFQIECIRLHSNLITNNISKSIENNSNILCCIPVNCGPNSIIEYQNVNNFRTNLFINIISMISISLIDNNNRPLDLNGLPFNLTIQLDIENFQ